LISESLTGTFPLVQGVYKLMRETIKLQETAKSYVSTAEPNVLKVVEGRAKTSFGAIANITRRIAGRMRSTDGKAQVASLAAISNRMDQGLTGQAGVFAAHRENLAARSELEKLQVESNAIEASHLAGLESARQAVEKLNDEAKATATQVIARALTTIGVVVVVGLTVGIAFSLVFSARIIGPVRRLTSAMSRLAEGALDVQVPERDRVDEIGNMADALQVFKENAIRVHTLEAEQKEMEARAAAERSAEMQRVADAFEA